MKYLKCTASCIGVQSEGFIFESMAEAILLAQNLKIQIAFTHNGTTIRLNGNEDLQSAVADWYKARGENGK